MNRYKSKPKWPALIFLIAAISSIGLTSDSWAGDAERNNPAFHKILLEAASQYSTFGRIDDYLRYAPALCSAPPPAPPRVSASADFKTHGRKLYYLYVKDKASYLAIGKPGVAQAQDAPPGQIIVKESWLPKPAVASTIGKEAATPAVAPALVADIKHALFIMVKVDPKTPDTDNGWIYGTLTPDGTTVTSAGRVQSCMTCHQAVPSGRLFGLKAPDRSSKDLKDSK